MKYFDLPRECHAASHFYKFKNDFISSNSANMKILWQRDLGREFEKINGLTLWQNVANMLRKQRGNSHSTSYYTGIVIYRCNYID